MPATFSNAYPFGLRDLKLFLITDPSTYAAGVDLPAARTMTVTPEAANAKLEGDDVTVAVHAMDTGGKWDLEGGGIDLATLAILTGNTNYTSGSTPNEVNYVNMTNLNQRPYFGLIGRAVTDSVKGVTLQLMRCKCTTGPKVELKNGAFAVTPSSGEYVADANGLYGRWIIRETAVAINTVWLSNLA